MDVKGKQVLVLGLGATGMSMARWLSARGARVRVADSREDPPHARALKTLLPGVRIDTGAFRRESFSGIDLIAISPGVPLAQPEVARAAADGVPVLGDVELFAQAKGSASKVIAITGSNGKSTVTAMSGAMCRAAGARTVVAGNIGLPVLDALDEGEEPDLYVLELSSFQLETTSSLEPVAAAMLNLSEDHLDRYASLAHYAAAKARIFRGGGTQVLNRNDRFSIAMGLPGRAIVTFGFDQPSGPADWGVVSEDGRDFLVQGSRRVLQAEELGVAGLHNAANALAALALCHDVGLAEEPMLQALRDFRGLPHRLSAVGSLNGITFFDDSKGTNVGATVAALSGLGRRSVLIAGGDGKGQDFSPLAAPVRRHARAVILIGRDRDRIRDALAHTGAQMRCAQTLAEAVHLAYAAAQPGDAVLLSPACASFDMFRDYRDRGEQFADGVRALIGKAGGVH